MKKELKNKNLPVIFLLLTQSFLCIAVYAQVSVVAPKLVGLSSERLSRIDTVMNQYIANGKMPGMVCLIARHGKIAYYKSFGKMDIEANTSMKNECYVQDRFHDQSNYFYWYYDFI